MSHDSGGSGTGGGFGTGGGIGDTASKVVLDLSTVNCGTVDPTTALKRGCGSVGCHGGAVVSSKLNLAPDDGLAARLKDQPAHFGDLICPTITDPFETCTTPPSACPSGELLVNSSDPSQSWMLRKLGATPGCGDVMPPAGYVLKPEDRTCVENIIKAIAGLP